MRRLRGDLGKLIWTRDAPSALTYAKALVGSSSLSDLLQLCCIVVVRSASTEWSKS
jgi:hypothetical protein